MYEHFCYLNKILYAIKNLGYFSKVMFVTICFVIHKQNVFKFLKIIQGKPENLSR